MAAQRSAEAAREATTRMHHAAQQAAAQARSAQQQANDHVAAAIHEQQARAHAAAAQQTREVAARVAAGMRAAADAVAAAAGIDPTATGGPSSSAAAGHEHQQEGVSAINNVDGHDANTFSPPVDIYDDTEARAWIVHVAVPGARREDISVSFDARRGELNVAGVVTRPGDERFIASLVQAERRVGFFERVVRIPPTVTGTAGVDANNAPASPKAPAVVDTEADMHDGDDKFAELMDLGGGETSTAAAGKEDGKEKGKEMEEGADAESPAGNQPPHWEVDDANTSARLEDGLLIITVPKPEPKEEWTVVKKVDIE